MLLPDLAQNFRNKISLDLIGFYEAGRFTEQETAACQRKYSLRAFLPGDRTAGHFSGNKSHWYLILCRLKTNG